MAQLSFHSPIGDLTLSEEEGRIVSLDWGWARDQRATPLLNQARDQVQDYLAGKRKDFDLPLDPMGTDFQKRVWKAMVAIGYGKTKSYGEIAAKLKSSPRAVGTACGRNPIPLIIPCHRVLGANGGLGGYSGEGGTDTKRWLLNLEGLTA
ncbi:Methylated-DNA--protein-cysteine methyltransferase, constitutive [Rhodospirillaceae bacterium LM-1]|nr:Methylated-DNA--protein-cysteine methyltransferase, constitutive [Rhodospirillaceae bacterium LM-1]